MNSTIRSAARLGTGILSLAAALCLTAPCHAQQQIDNSTVCIINSYPAFPGYDAYFAIDIGPDQYITDYASNGGRTDTFLDFMFVQQYTFTQIIETDRTTSGGGNDHFFGGTFDFNTDYVFIFSNDPDFATEEGRVEVTRDTPSQPTDISASRRLPISPTSPPSTFGGKWSPPMALIQGLQISHSLWLNSEETGVDDTETGTSRVVRAERPGISPCPSFNLGWRLHPVTMADGS